MELVIQHLIFPSFSKTIRVFKPKVCTQFDHNSCYGIDLKSLEHERKLRSISFALPETAASVAIAATVVGVAATLLIKRTEASEETEIPMRICDNCGGSGICPECKGEGFVVKKLPDVNAERARLSAKNMATRYTAGLPKKWSYCTKCSSSRSCTTCDGQGKLTV